MTVFCGSNNHVKVIVFGGEMIVDGGEMIVYGREVTVNDGGVIVFGVGMTVFGAEAEWTWRSNILEIMGAVGYVFFIFCKCVCPGQCHGLWDPLYLAATESGGCLPMLLEQVHKYFRCFVLCMFAPTVYTCFVILFVPFVLTPFNIHISRFQIKLCVTLTCRTHVLQIPCTCLKISSTCPILVFLSTWIPVIVLDVCQNNCEFGWTLSYIVQFGLLRVV
jgi:hypothetical protein